MARRRDWFISLMFFLIALGRVSLIQSNSTYSSIYNIATASTIFLAEIILIYNYVEYMAVRYSDRHKTFMEWGNRLNVVGIAIMFYSSFITWGLIMSFLVPFAAGFIIMEYFQYRYKNGKLPYYEYLEFYNDMPSVRLEYDFFSRLGFANDEHLSIHTQETQYPKEVTFNLKKIETGTVSPELYAIVKKTDKEAYIMFPHSFVELYDFKGNEVQFKGELSKDGKSLLISKFKKATIKDLLRSWFGFAWNIIQGLMP